MIVAIQQPEHLPWLGFFDKMRKCDLYIYLDNVQFKKRYFENRNKILTANGPQWVTVPVNTKGAYTQKINEVEINNSINWQQKYLESIRRSYSKTSFYNEFFPVLENILKKDYQKLLNLNLALINAIRDYCGIKTPCIMASDIIDDDVKGSDLIFELCVKTKADTYISGPDGRNYLDLEKFQKSGIKVIYHDYEHPAYKQRHTGDFVSHISIIDFIFNSNTDNIKIVEVS